MIDSGQKTSLLIPSQLPEFVRDEPSYANFVLFLQAYYEWLEENDNVTDRTKNILNYKDVDKTTSEFLDYFTNDFLSYFPKEMLADEKKVIKIAKELYQSKGTPASYQFLFKVLYGTEVDFFYTKDAVLKASAGKWYVAKSLKLSSTNSNFLNIQNLRVFGETTKSIATVETSVLAGTKTEVFISNIERLFQSGEFIRVVDSNNQDVLFDGQTLRAKVVGQISQIKIDPNNRGLLYQPGDPVVVYGGLNSEEGIGATATVGTTTTGSIQRVSTLNGGFGYRVNPYGKVSVTNAPGAILEIGSLSPSSANAANATYVPIDYIGKKYLTTIGAANYVFSNVATSNANTTLANAFTFTSFATYPISSVLVKNGGGGISITPVVFANSSYYSEDDAVLGDLASLGILAPIQIVSSGTYYRANDRIDILGGSGYGAYANVTSVGANGEILTVSYVYPQSDTPHHYPLGGMGYRLQGLPTANVVSANATASGASLYVPGILGAGAEFGVSVDRAGSITTINIQNYGEDYISTPNVSLKVQDIVVSNVALTNIPQTGDIVYQGTDFANSSYKAIVSEVNITTPYADPTQSIWTVRVYNYNAIPSKTLSLKVVEGYQNYDKSEFENDKNIIMSVSGVTTYGDGTAKATAIFLNGLTISEGQYLDTAGQLSSYDVLESEIYNNFTYEITLEKEIAKYREILLNLLHPTGMKVLGKYALKSNTAHDFTAYNLLEAGHTLGYYTGTTGSYATMTSNWTNQSNNVVNLYALAGANSQTFIASNSSITLTTANGVVVHSEVANVNHTSVTTGGPTTYSVHTDWNSDFSFILKARDSANTGNNPFVLQISSTGDWSANSLNNVLSLLTTGSVVSIVINDPFHTSVPTTSQNITFTSDWTTGGTPKANVNLQYPAGVNISSTFGVPIQSINITIPVVTTNTDTVILRDNVWTTFANVAYVKANSGTNIINITSLTNSYNIVNNGVYSNTAYPLKDIVYAGDYVLVANNTEKQVQSVNYTSGIIYLNGNLSSSSNSLMSIRRTISTNIVRIDQFLET